MLRITGNINATLNKAVETNSLPALQEKLDYLNNWGEDSQYAVQVEAFPNKDGDMDVTFYNKDGGRFSVGQLVHHSFDNSWGVHT
jgi:hypothetical protein